MNLELETSHLLAEADNFYNREYPYVDSTFYVPNYYENPTLHDNAKQVIDIYGKGCYTLALASNDNPIYISKSIDLLHHWILNNNNLSLKDDSPLTMVYKGQKFIFAYNLLKKKGVSFDHCFESVFNIWLDMVYLKACHEVIAESWRRPNNKFYWGYLGKIAALLYGKGDKESASVLIYSLEDFFKSSIARDDFIFGKKYELWRENLRNNSFLWYTYFSLAPMSKIAWLSFKEFGCNSSLKILEPVIQSFFDYITKVQEIPDKFPYKRLSGWKGKVQNYLWPSEDNFVWVTSQHFFEAMGQIYGNAVWTEYASSFRPIGNNGNVWCFPAYRILKSLL